MECHLWWKRGSRQSTNDSYIRYKGPSQLSEELWPSDGLFRVALSWSKGLGLYIPPPRTRDRMLRKEGPPWARQLSSDKDTSETADTWGLQLAGRCPRRWGVASPSVRKWASRFRAMTSTNQTDSMGCSWELGKHLYFWGDPKRFSRLCDLDVCVFFLNTHVYIHTKHTFYPSIADPLNC